MSAGDDLSQPGKFQLQSCRGSRSMKEVTDSISRYRADAEDWVTQEADVHSFGHQFEYRGIRQRTDGHLPQACFDCIRGRRLVVGSVAAYRSGLHPRVGDLSLEQPYLRSFQNNYKVFGDIFGNFKRCRHSKKFGNL